MRGFALRLALACGRADVDTMLASISSRQLTEWMAYCELYPFGQQVSDELLAQLLALTFNINRGKSQSPVKAEDFLGGKRGPQDWRQMLATIRSAKEAARGGSREPGHSALGED